MIKEIILLLYTFFNLLVYGLTAIFFGINSNAVMFSLSLFLFIFSLYLIIGYFIKVRKFEISYKIYIWCCFAFISWITFPLDLIFTFNYFLALIIALIFTIALHILSNKLT